MVEGRCMRSMWREGKGRAVKSYAFVEILTLMLMCLSLFVRLPHVSVFPKLRSRRKSLQNAQPPAKRL